MSFGGGKGTTFAPPSPPRSIPEPTRCRRRSRETTAPAIAGAISAADRWCARPPRPDRHGTILLVEDEGGAARVSTKAPRLIRAAHTVIRPATASRRLEELWQAGGEVDSFVSDVVMPEGRPTLAPGAAQLIPTSDHLRVPGYAEEAFEKLRIPSVRVPAQALQRLKQARRQSH